MNTSEKVNAAIEMIAEQSVIFYKKALEISGSTEIAKDALFQYIKVILYGRDRPKFMF